MPYADPDFSDPMMSVGVVLPGSAEAAQDAAYALAEEFSRLGYPEEKILYLFRTPFYRGSYSAYQALGEEAIQKIVRQCCGVWGRLRLVDQDAEGLDQGLIPPEAIQGP